MFTIERKPRNRLAAAFEICEVTYVATVRAARGNSSNAIFGLLMNVFFIASFIIALYVTMSIMGMRSNMLHGDFVLFLMSGVLSYMTYSKTMRAVYGAEGPSSPMMNHAPMNSVVAVASSALSALYIQVFSCLLILFVYHIAFKPVEIAEPAFAMFMVLAAWIFGISSGLVLMSIRLWAPKLAPILLMVISRANIFASGKMFLGNTLTFAMLKMFDWNPLFHIVDQMRGAVFINYSPRNSEVAYIFEVSFALMVIGMMLDFFARKHHSQSSNAR